MTVAEQTKDVEVVKKEIKAYVENLPMKVTNQAEMEAAVVRLLEVRKATKERAKWFDDNILSHSKAAYDAAKKTWDQHKKIKEELLRPLKEWDQQTDQNIGSWKQKEAARIAAEQAKANAKYKADRAKAEAKGKDPDAVKPMKIYQEPPKTLKTEAGSYTTKSVKKLRILDESKIPGRPEPHAFWMVTLNTKVVEAALRAGQEVPGCVLEEVFESSMRV